jgi:hypothetical protein
MRNFSTFLTFVMLAIFTAMVAMAFGFPRNARFMPLIVGVPGMLFCLAQLVLDWRKARAIAVGAAPAQPVAALRGLELPDIGEPILSEREVVHREIVMWAYFLAFVAGLLLFGFWIAVPVMLVSFLRFEGGVSWKASLAAAIVASLTLYLVFEVTLRIRLHPGFVTATVLKALS